MKSTQANPKNVYALVLSLALLLLTVSHLQAANETWRYQRYPGFDFYYTTTNVAEKEAYLQLVHAGIGKVAVFFGTPYPRRFKVWIQPNRTAFDKAYQKNYHQPDFHSECWLVATGDGYRISILSPKTWDGEPCKNRYSDYADRVKTQQLITHELVHVYHGQCNPHTALDNGSGMDWFAEGLAYYASGQLDAAGRRDVQKALRAGKAPVNLEALSNYPDIGLRYSMCGSLANYIDKAYGRNRLKALMTLTQKKVLLAAMKLSERELLSRWASTETEQRR